MPDSRRFQRLQQLFTEALEHPEDGRGAWLDGLHGDDLELVADLRRLLARERRDAVLPDAVPDHLLDAALGARADDTRRLPLRAGSFELQEEIGHGGMGRVFRGVRSEGGLRQEAAVKVLRAELRHGPALSRFLAERRVLAGLDHPGIARLLEAGETADGVPYVAMELVRGRSLLQHCAEERLGVPARLALFRQVLAAVAHAHRALVVHRDIKPSNVMVDRDGHVRLLDFGIAKALDDLDSTVTAERFFTPAYAAPEQLLGEPVTVGCDIYALGALLYELLCGAPPFEVAGKRAAEVERLILSTPPRPMEHAFTSLPAARRDVLGAPADPAAWRVRLRGDLESIVQRAMRKEVGARYASVEALDKDIERHLSHRPVSARGRSRLYRARKFARRHAVACSAAALVALSAGIAAVLVVNESVVAGRERDRAREALSTLREAFVAADPSGISAGAASARSILDAAARRIGQGVSTRPDVHAELAVHIGEVRLALGIVDPEATWIAQARDWATAQGETGLAARLQLLDARRLLAAHALDDADAALASMEDQRPHDLSVQLSRGYYWLLRDEPARAIPILERVAGAFATDVANDERTRALWHLAEAQRLAAQPGAGLATLQGLRLDLAGLLGDEHPSVVVTRLRSVDTLLDLGRTREAVTEARQVVDVIEAAYGRSSAITGLAETTLAHALSRDGRYAESLEPFRRAATAYEGSLGRHHANTARTLFNLAQMLAYVTPADPAAATAFEGAITGASAARHPGDPLVTYFRAGYVDWLAARGDGAKARAVLVPAGPGPDLAAAGEGLAARYRALLGEHFGPLVCASAARGADNAAVAGDVDAARRLFCAGAGPRAAAGL